MPCELTIGGLRERVGSAASAPFSRSRRSHVTHSYIVDADTPLLTKDSVASAEEGSHRACERSREVRHASEWARSKDGPTRPAVNASDQNTPSFFLFVRCVSVAMKRLL